MADTRICRAVGLDVHGVLVERQVAADIREKPESIVVAAMEATARCYHQAILDVIGLDVAIDPIILDRPSAVFPETNGDVGDVTRINPAELWRTEQWALENTPHTTGGQVLRHRDFLVAANMRALRKHFTKLVSQLEDEPIKKIARKIRSLRRLQESDYVMYDDVREFVSWVRTAYGAPLHLVTGQERYRVDNLIKQCAVDREQLDRIFTAEDLGAHKLNQRFWSQLLKRLGIKPHEFVMIGNEVPIDGACTQEGIPAIIFDRGGIRERYYQNAPHGERPRFLSLDDEIPPYAPFIAFAKTTEEIKAWLGRMPYEPNQKP